MELRTPRLPVSSYGAEAGTATGCDHPWTERLLNPVRAFQSGLPIVKSQLLPFQRIHAGAAAWCASRERVVANASSSNAGRCGHRGSPRGADAERDAPRVLQLARVQPPAETPRAFHLARRGAHPGREVAIGGNHARLAGRGVGRDHARDVVVGGAAAGAGREADVNPGSRAGGRRRRPMLLHRCREGCRTARRRSNCAPSARMAPVRSRHQPSGREPRTFIRLRGLRQPRLCDVLS
jgi:hypothetical protein